MLGDGGEAAVLEGLGGRIIADHGLFLTHLEPGRRFLLLLCLFGFGVVWLDAEIPASNIVKVVVVVLMPPRGGCRRGASALSTMASFPYFDLFLSFRRRWS